MLLEYRWQVLQASGPFQRETFWKKLSFEMIGTRNDVTGSFLAKNLQGCGKWCNFVTTK